MKFEGSTRPTHQVFYLQQPHFAGSTYSLGKWTVTMGPLLLDSCYVVEVLTDDDRHLGFSQPALANAEQDTLTFIFCPPVRLVGTQFHVRYHRYDMDNQHFSLLIEAAS